jgi:hypothetical protein
MRFCKTSLCALVLGGFTMGTALAETYPPGLSNPENINELVPDITNSTPNPLRLSVSNVAYGGSGGVDIPFTMNQRATVWVAIYEIGSTDTGPTNINGAVVRYVAQDKFIAAAPNESGIALAAGNNVIRWDGRDWNGEEAGPGNYEFDVIAVNNLDPSALVGISSNGMPDHIFDLRNGDNWCHLAASANPDRGQFWGSLALGKIGTDYVANPSAYELWNFEESVQMLPSGDTVGGIRPDVDDPTAFYVSMTPNGPNCGVYRLIRNDASKTLDRDPNFADNGFSHLPLAETERSLHLSVWKDKLYTANWSTAEIPAPSFCVWDKATGEFLQNVDQHREFFWRYRIDDNGVESFSAGGVTSTSVNETGLWVTGWRGTQVIKIDHDFNLIWSNGPGDFYDDQISVERAAALGFTGNVANGELSLVLDAIPDYKSRVLITTARHNTIGHRASILGRDGSGIGRIWAGFNIGPYRQHANTNVAVIQNNCSGHGGDLYCGENAGSPGTYDGLVFNTFYDIVHQEFRTYEATEPRNPAMAMHMGFDIQTGKMGADVTAVEEVDGAGTPESYSLGAAYPNPFNPETAFDFTIAADDNVRIDVFNAVGQRMDTLVDNFKPAGTYKVTWNGRDANGAPVSSGAYFYRMQASEFSDVRAMTLLQ